jgi:3-oxoacyl-[acyl-carrier-protein] synthase II
MAARIARRFSLAGKGITFNAACASSLAALAAAAERIANGGAEVILVWAAEIVSEFVFAGFASLKALSPAVCRPFDRQRDGLVLGEGAALLLLMSADRARREGRRPLAVCRGWGMANDAVHLTAPDRQGRGLVRACRRALRRANMEPREVAAIKAHGTGTIHNDAMEMKAFATLWEGLRPPPFFSVKGALGHTLGAAGALETVVAIAALRNALLPPTAGLRRPEPAFSGQLAATPREFSGSSILLTNSGFGGINAALLLTRGDEV